MKKGYFLLLLVFIAVFHFKTQAHKDSLRSGKLEFIENLSQWNENILFKANIDGGAVFFEKTRFTFAFEDAEAIEKILSFKYLSADERKLKNNPNTIINCHSYKMNFIGANTNFITKAHYPSDTYENYFIGNNPKHWASRVRRYKEFEYIHLWDNINLNVFEKDYLLKYEIVAEPNADIAKVKFSYDGAKNIAIDAKGNLIITTSINKIIEIKPKAWVLDGVKEKEVVCNFKLKKNILSFEFPEGYDHSKVLVVDPTLIFSSYSGSTSDNWGYTATYDKNGFLYAGGNVFSLGYPTTTGAYQINYGGGSCDMAISKYDTTGHFMIYSTYLGGDSTDVPNSLITNDNGELFILGTTGSNNFPTTANAYSSVFHGGTPYVLTYVLQYPHGSDIVVARLSSDGTQLLSSTYLGGSGNDGLNSVDTLKHNYADDVRGEIMIDKNSNVYIVSSTTSIDFPVTAGAFQTTFGGGKQDGCIAKLDQNLTTLIWCSYLGGNKNDAIYSIKLDPSENIYVAGGTCSPNFPVTPGVLFPIYPGGKCDGFITHISKLGDAILQSTYYGAAGYDQVYLLETDRNGNVYVLGQTDAPANTYIFNALWSYPGGGQFVSKLSSSLNNKIWSTTFGSGTAGPNISPTAFLVDVCNSVYLSGWGGAVNGFGGTTGLPITANAFQTTTDNSDYYFLVIKDDASGIVYGTYFGGPQSYEHVDGGTSRFDRKGRIYQSVCAGCGAHSDFPTTAGAVSNTNNSSNCNNGVIKFDFKLPIIIAEFIVPPVGCTPYNVSFQNTSTSGSGSMICNWSFGDGTYSNQFSPNHTYTQSGVYDIRLIVSDTGSCNSSDTISHQMVVLSGVNSTLPTDTICIGQQTQIGVLPQVGSNLTYSWSPTTGLSNANAANPFANPLGTTNYTLYISNGVCTDTLVQKVLVYNFLAEAGPNINVCQGDTITLHGSVIGSSGSVLYIWSSNPAFSDTLNSPLNNPNFNAVVQNNISYYLKVSNGLCDKTDSIHLTVSTVSIDAGNNKTICFGDSTFLSVSNLIPGMSLTYSWTPTSSIIIGGNTSSPLVNPSTTTTYYATASNSLGCSKVDSMKITVIKLIPTVSYSNVSCFNSCNGHINVSVSGGSPNYQFNWSNGANTSNISNLCPDTYSLIITDSNNCKAVVSQIITQPQPLVITFPDTTHVVCNGICDGAIISSVTGGTPNYQFHWISGQTTDTISNLCAGLYTLTVTDANNCTTTASVPVLDTSNFNAIGHYKQPNCADSCNGIAWVTASAGVPPYTYLWNTFSTNDSIFQLCSSIYNVRVTESHGCIHMVYIQLPQPQPVFIDTLSLINPLCHDSCNGFISIIASGGTSPYQYLWNTSQGTPSINNLCAGIYYITVTDSAGCSASDTFQLIAPAPITITLTSTDVPCESVCNSVITASVQGGVGSYSYAWSTGSSGNPITNGCFGLNYVSVTDANNCEAIKSINVNITTSFPTNFKAWIGNDTLKKIDTIYESLSAQLNSTIISGYQYQWSPSSGLNNPSVSNPIATPSGTTTYYVTVTDTYGCQKVDSVKIVIEEVICDEPFIYVPNAFSPNQDNKNDVLYVRSNIITELTFLIYDRWGEKVFESHQLQQGWDGNYKGKACEPGVYVYYIDAGCYAKKRYKHKGNITLIK
ncbi:MAG: gliding motility-associated C-terminal domain-containing protein [Bacteroidota bacterium]